MQEAVYQYNLMTHQLTGFSPNLLHHEYELASLGLLHPEVAPASPPPNAPEDKITFTKSLQELQELICGVVIKNQEEACRQATKYYLMRSMNLPVNSWVWVYNPRASPPEGDKRENRKLSVHNSNMGKVAKVDESGQVARRFLVHGSKVRLCQMGNG